MVDINTPTAEQINEWSEWVESRPEIVKEVARKLHPWKLYKFGDHRVTLYSISEDGTVTVNVTGEFNSVVFERRVFGVNPTELVECDFPGENEITGSLLSFEEAGSFVNQLKVDVKSGAIK